jgi:hypothetical protein
VLGPEFNPQYCPKKRKKKRIKKCNWAIYIKSKNLNIKRGIVERI